MKEISAIKIAYEDLSESLLFETIEIKRSQSSEKSGEESFRQEEHHVCRPLTSYLLVYPT